MSKTQKYKTLKDYADAVSDICRTKGIAKPDRSDVDLYDAYLRAQRLSDKPLTLQVINTQQSGSILVLG
jgi:hypothetical protein